MKSYTHNSYDESRQKSVNCNMGLSYSGLIFSKFLKIIISIYNQNKPSQKLIFVSINLWQPFMAKPNIYKSVKSSFSSSSPFLFLFTLPSLFLSVEPSPFLLFPFPFCCMWFAFLTFYTQNFSNLPFPRKLFVLKPLLDLRM